MENLLSSTAEQSELGKFIGRGINIMNAKGPYADELKRPVLKIDKVAKDLVKSVPVEEGNLHYQSSEDLKEIYSEWSINASTDVKTPFFSGGFKAEYSNKNRHNSCNKFFKGIVSIKGYSHILSPPENAGVNKDALVDFLISNGYADSVALGNIAGAMNPAELFNAYGTHVIVGGLSGGSIQISALYTSDTTVSEQRFDSTLKFACGFATGESTGGFKDEHREVLSKTELKATSRGGDPRIIGTLHDYEKIPQTFERWTETVTEDKYVLTDITAAIPIWEFCDNEQRRKNLTDIYRASNDEQFKLIEAYFPSPKEKENVIIYSHRYKELKVAKNRLDFAFLSEGAPLILEKELVTRGTDVYRFKLAGASTDRAYLCVTEKGPLGDFVHLAFTGDKDSRYSQFFLEKITTVANTYFLKAIETGCNVVIDQDFYLTARRTTHKDAFTIYSKERE